MSFKIIRELFKTADNGQWQILRKAFINAQVPKGDCNCGAHHTSSPNMHYDWCNGVDGAAKISKISRTPIGNALGKYVKTGDSKEFNQILSNAPKGSVDFGDIFHIAKNDPSGKVKDLVKGSDFIDHLNRHLDGVKDMKDIHDNHGGLDAVEGILKNYHGANGIPSEYSSLNFGKHNKKIQAEAQDLVFPGKGSGEYSGTKDPADRPDYSSHIDSTLDADVHKTMDDAQNASDPFHNSNWHLWKKHTKAAMARAMDAFKKYHKL